MYAVVINYWRTYKKITEKKIESNLDINKIR